MPASTGALSDDRRTIKMAALERTGQLEMEDKTITGQPGAGDLKISVQLIPDTEPLGAGYGLTEDQAIFFKEQTRIYDDDDLRTHILAVQERAWKVFPYASTRYFTFLKLGIAALPEYERIIKLGRERPDEVFLDIGCCFGVDSRKVVADGFPLKNVVTTDLKKEFFDLGHALFNTTPETYPISFVPGDALAPDILQIVPPVEEPPSTERPDLLSLTSLNPLAGRCSVIYASNFFHLFSEENQLQLAKALAGLLSPRPGSMVCGEHAGSLQQGIKHGEIAGRGFDMFQHCPESWSALWDGEVFAKGKVKVDTKLELVEGNIGRYHRLLWSVVRL